MKIVMVLTSRDRRLITGQNPASSTSTAQALMKFLGEKAAHASA